MTRRIMNGSKDLSSSLLIHTGNILTLHEIKKLVGQNPTDELIESLKITISEWKKRSSNAITEYGIVNVLRTEENLFGNLIEDRSDLKISVKIFLQSKALNILKQALDKVFEELQVHHIDTLVVVGNLEDVEELQAAWAILEPYIENGQLKDVGVSDVDTNVFIELYKSAKIKPSIIQINLAVCCVVPPELQEFCKQNNVTLLTHSDPKDILPVSSLNQVLGLPEEEFHLIWITRFQIYVKDRGVLGSKGYLISASRNPDKSFVEVHQ